MTGDAILKIRAGLVAAGMAAPDFDALTDALVTERPDLGFDTPQIEACAALAFDLATARQHRAIAIDAVRFDVALTMTPEKRIHANAYNATLERLWAERLALAIPVTEADVIAVASAALAITNARHARL